MLSIGAADEEGEKMGSFALRMKAFEDSLQDIRVIPRIPAGRRTYLSATEPLATTVDRDDSASWTAFISYVDAGGDASERRVTCHAIEGFGGASHITAYCHERRAARTFRVDRIRELACAETGEVFDPATHFDLLRQSGALRCEDKVLTDVARILVFLARCDGEYHPLEEEGLSDQFSRYCVRFNGTDKLMEQALTGCRQLAPDSHDMIKAIGKMAKSPGGQQVARFVLDAGAAIIDADGRHAEEETRWAFELSSTLKMVCDGRVD